MRLPARLVASIGFAVVFCCTSSPTPLQSSEDAGAEDAGPTDAGAAHDAGVSSVDAGPQDSGFWVSPIPPLFPSYSHGTCPTLVAGTSTATTLNTDFATGDEVRQFRLIVPPDYDGGAWPLLFGWHWLNASAGSFENTGELDSAAEQMHMLVVLPDKLYTDAGSKAYEFDWPFIDPVNSPREILFFDDMLACVTQQYNVDPRRVYAVGVSAGGLWVTFLSTTPEADRFAAIESLSGGLGEDPTGTWKMEYIPQANKFPAIVLWGGPLDWLIVDFAQASQRYAADLLADHHFVVECEHDAGHAVPPIPQPDDGGTRFEPLWQFMLDHPYGLPPGYSPYQTTGLPPTFPSWCWIDK